MVEERDLLSASDSFSRDLRRCSLVRKQMMVFLTMETYLLELLMAIENG
jgi:hypothetical protein